MAGLKCFRGHKILDKAYKTMTVRYLIFLTSNYVKEVNSAIHRKRKGDTPSVMFTREQGAGKRRKLASSR